MLMQAFSRAAARPKGTSGNDFLDAILHERPALKGKPVYFPGEYEHRKKATGDGHRAPHYQGRHAHIVFIGDQVFKGPKHHKDIHRFDDEHQILKQLEGSGLPVPRVACVGKETYFYGMTRLTGVTLWQMLPRLTPDERREIAKDIVSFIIGLARALPTRGGLYASHNDLHVGNILIDPVTKKLAGIVDFGSVKWRKKDHLAACTATSLEKFIRPEFERRKAELPDLPPPPDFPPLKTP